MPQLSLALKGPSAVVGGREVRKGPGDAGLNVVTTRGCFWLAHKPGMSYPSGRVMETATTTRAVPVISTSTQPEIKIKAAGDQPTQRS